MHLIWIYGIVPAGGLRDVLEDRCKAIVDDLPRRTALFWGFRATQWSIPDFLWNSVECLYAFYSGTGYFSGPSLDGFFSTLPHDGRRV